MWRRNADAAGDGRIDNERAAMSIVRDVEVAHRVLAEQRDRRCMRTTAEKSIAPGTPKPDSLRL